MTKPFQSRGLIILNIILTSINQSLMKLTHTLFYRRYHTTNVTDPQIGLVPMLPTSDCVLIVQFANAGGETDTFFIQPSCPLSYLLLSRPGVLAIQPGWEGGCSIPGSRWEACNDLHGEELAEGWNAGKQVMPWVRKVIRTQCNVMHGMSGERCWMERRFFAVSLFFFGSSSFSLCG
jgi:hypothetical protein